jgi:hypothetical protein
VRLLDLRRMGRIYFFALMTRTEKMKTARCIMNPYMQTGIEAIVCPQTPDVHEFASILV